MTGFIFFIMWIACMMVFTPVVGTGIWLIIFCILALIGGSNE